MDPVETVHSPQPSHDEERLLAAATHMLVDEVCVSPAETRASFARVQAAIREASPGGGGASLAGAAPSRDGARGLRLTRLTSTGGWRRRTWYAALTVAVGVALFVAGRGGMTPHGASHAPASVTTYATRNGERADITLPDGSTATLNVGSRLLVPTDFAAGNRTLTLDGEALFTVNHRAGAPFTVVSGNTTARVLGTTFLVRRYATDPVVTVAVRDGRVAVRSAVLSAGQQMTVTRSGATRVRGADPAQFGFATGTLTLNDVSLCDAITELNRWYDVDIRLGDERLARRALHATFGTGSADLTEVLAGALNVRVVQDGRVITLYPK